MTIEPTNLYKPFKRMFEGPADVDSVFDSIQAAEEFASSVPAYEGQIITVVNDDLIGLFLIHKGTLVRVPLSIFVDNPDNSISSLIYTDARGLVISNKVNISPRSTNILKCGDDGLYVSKYNVDIVDPPEPEPNPPSGGTSDIRKFVKIIGDGINNEITVVHNLNTLDININIWTNDVPRELYICDTVVLDKNTVQLIFNQVPQINQYKVVIVG